MTTQTKKLVTKWTLNAVVASAAVGMWAASVYFHMPTALQFILVGGVLLGFMKAKD